MKICKQISVFQKAYLKLQLLVALTARVSLFCAKNRIRHTSDGGFNWAMLRLNIICFLIIVMLNFSNEWDHGRARKLETPAATLALYKAPCTDFSTVEWLTAAAPGVLTVSSELFSMARSFQVLSLCPSLPSLQNPNRNTCRALATGSHLPASQVASRRSQLSFRNAAHPPRMRGAAAPSPAPLPAAGSRDPG